MLIGFAGIILPFLPDLVLVFLGALVYGLYTGFSTVSLSVVIIFGVLAILSFLIDIISSTLGAKAQKASKWGQIGAVVGGLVGIFTSGIFGIILGPVLGVVLFEILFAKRNFNQALNAGLGSLVGFIFGSLLKLSLAVFMIGWFIKLTLL
jgi:hypothetical protein